MNKLIKHLICISFAPLTSQISAAQTQVSGNLTTSTTWSLSGSPYICVGTVIVTGNGTNLTIENGVEVLMPGAQGIVVRNFSGLIADGVTFQNLGPNPGWAMVTADSGAVDIQNCTFQEASIELKGTGTQTIQSTLMSNGNVSIMSSSNALVSGSTLGAGGISVGSSSPTITNNTIGSVSLYGTASPVITGNTFTTSTPFTIAFSGSNNPTPVVSGNTFLTDSKINIYGTISSNTTLQGYQGIQKFVLTGGSDALRVLRGATLVSPANTEIQIQPVVTEIRLDPGSGFMAIGTTFNNLTPSLGSTMLYADSATAEFQGCRFLGASLDLRRANAPQILNSSFSANSTVWILNTNGGNITGNTMEGTSSLGNSSPTISGNSVMSIWLSGSSSPIVTGNTFTTSTPFTIAFSGSNNPTPVVSGNTFLTDSKINIYGTISSNTTLQGYQGIQKYWLENNISIGSGARMNLMPGFEIQHGTHRVIQVDSGASLYAEGVTFGIVPGLNPEIGIYCYGTVNLRKCVFNGVGVRFFDFGTGTIDSCDFLVPSGQYGVMGTAAGLVDARHNYWNGDQGPVHPSNPNGNGCRVSDGVDFVPWLPIPGNAPVSVIASLPPYQSFGFNLFYGRTPESQGRLVVEDSIGVSSLVSKIKDVHVVATLNGAPMTVQLNTPLVSLDEDNDGDIDSIPCGAFPNIRFVKFLVLSSPFTTNQQNLALETRITDINGMPVSINRRDDVSFLFAKHTTGRPFDLRNDGYFFRNRGPLSFGEVVYILGTYNITEVPLALIFYAIANASGRCFGMAATSGSYFLEPSRRPAPGEVHTWDSTNLAVLDNINLAHISQGLYATDLTWGVTDRYPYLQQELANDRPVVLALRRVGSTLGHAVLGTQLVQLSQRNAFIQVYDNKYPDSARVASFDFTSNSFSYYPYSSVAGIPRAVFSEWDVRSSINHFLGYATRDLFNTSRVGFATACPVNLLVRSGSGQRFGYLNDGTFVNEINGAEAFRTSTGSTPNDSITVLLAPLNGRYSVEVNGSSSGVMRFEHFRAIDSIRVILSLVDSVSVLDQTVARYSESDSTRFYIDRVGNGSIDTIQTRINTIVVGVIESPKESQLPTTVVLAQNYPNPFNPSTTIKYDLPRDTRVSLKIYDVLGREVATLVNGEERAGYKSIEWNASGFTSGVYFYRLEAGSFVSVKKLLLLK
jgi:parallel beta-helix repeat protein